MPQWQADLVAEWESYATIVAKLEAEIGPISDYSNPLGQAAIKDRLPNASRDLRRYLRWADDQAALGEDGSMEAYIRYRNDLYYRERGGEAA